MSKPPNIFLPALGVTGVVLGAAYGFSMRDYGDDRVAVLKDRVVQIERQAAQSVAVAKSEAEAAIAAAGERSKSLTAPAPAKEGAYGLGRVALPEEIAAWDVDVLPDGRGLPAGRGSVMDGEEVFADACGSCHGDFAEGVDNWPVLAGGFDTLADEDPVKTVGSYWPYLSTVFDYVNRSMPFGAAGTLSEDDVYAIVAYILYSNDLVDDEFVLSHENFMDVAMHNADGFVVDDRAALEYAQWSGEPCMQNCKDDVQVTMRSVFLVNTPPEGGSESVMNHARSEPLPAFTAAGPSFIPKSGGAAEPKPEPTSVKASVDADVALIEAGRKVFRKCKACHQIGEGAQNKSGPQLNGIIGRAFGDSDGFAYSAAIKAARDAGRVWDEAEMAAFLAKPKSYLKGTKMAFAGLRKDADIAAIIAYLNSTGD